MRVLAFDPGYGRTGWGVVERSDRAPGFAACGFGVIETASGQAIALRLAELAAAAAELVARFAPDQLVMETLFFGRNHTTAAGVYQAQGVLLSIAGNRCLPVIELSPNTIKSVITGGGRADKSQVTQMVQRLLGIDTPIRPDDAADALAGAIVGLLQMRGNSALRRGESLSR